MHHQEIFNDFPSVLIHITFGREGVFPVCLDIQYIPGITDGLSWRYPDVHPVQIHPLDLHVPFETFLLSGHPPGMGNSLPHRDYSTFTQFWWLGSKNLTLSFSAIPLLTPWTIISIPGGRIQSIRAVYNILSSFPQDRFQISKQLISLPRINIPKFFSVFNVPWFLNCTYFLLGYN